VYIFGLIFAAKVHLSGEPDIIKKRKTGKPKPKELSIMDAMEFFQSSAGEWRSQRTTHHLAFRQAEIGDSNIQVTALAAGDERVAEICKIHSVDPSRAAGGAFVTWHGSMSWDKEDENHKGSTVFAIVPDPENPRQGLMLRERGYAETAPVAGRFEMDEDDALLLITEYETMSSIERFWFANPNVRMRTSTVKRFGGPSTATFCTEVRIASEEDAAPEAAGDKATGSEFYSALGW
jgi:CpeS-like protein